MHGPGTLAFGPHPLVVGVVRSPAALGRPPAACDVLEIRVDLLGLSAPWREAARAWRAAGRPVLFTARSAREGGEWSGDEAARQACYRAALPDVSAVDVELRCGWLADFLPAAQAAGRPVIGSFHDFAATPSDAVLDELVGEGQRLGVEVVKVAAFLRDADDVERLARLPARYPDQRICVLGMGPLGPASRITLPLAGSCLTYGFADTASAPGQVEVGELRRRLAEAHPGYRSHLQAQRV